MQLKVALGLAAVLCLAATGCTRTPVRAASGDAPAVSAPPATPSSARIIRASGIVQAVRSHTIRVPQLAQTAGGRSPQLTLVALARNGTFVKQGDILAEFDPTTQLDDQREAKAKLSDMQHQLEQTRAQVNSDAVKRTAAIREAEVDLGKAELQLKIGEVLADLERRKNEAKAATARERVASLRKSHELRVKAEAASVRVLELKCDRQKLLVDRIQLNIDNLSMKAPHAGMVALENVWRSGSMGPPQVGDQMWPNQPVVRVFDPSEMVVEAQVNEPDVAVLGSLSRATVHLDAYPNAVFQAQLESASPVATAGLESPVKSFSARFHIAAQDPRLLPDLSASLEIELPKTGGAK